LVLFLSLHQPHILCLLIFALLYKVIDNQLYKHQSVTPALSNRVNRLKYQDNYAAEVRIVKTEPNAIASNGRAPISYILENAYPYSIEAVPLSYGSSQLTRVNVNLYYSRHTVVYGDNEIDPLSELDPDDPAAGNFGTIPGERNFD